MGDGFEEGFQIRLLVKGNRLLFPLISTHGRRKKSAYLLCNKK